MKPQLRYKNFDLNQLFDQRLSYEKHKRKLEQLSHRKSYYINTDRINQLEDFKVRKHNSFLKDIFNRSKDINKSNLKIFQKLSVTQDQIPSSSASKFKESEINPFKKRVIEQTKLENQRMNYKITTMPPSIKTKKIISQYEDIVKIKNRISRYESSPGSNKLLSKNEKFLNLSLSKSVKSNTSLKHTNQLPIEKPIRKLKIDQKKLMSTSLNNPSLKEQKRPATFYKKEDVIKFKVQQTQAKTNLSNRRKLNQLNHRPFTQAETHKPIDRSEPANQTQQPFFTTEVEKKGRTIDAKQQS